jgi:hypothetical protein
MMMHDEGTALYDLFADAIVKNQVEIALIFALTVTVMVGSIFFEKLFTALKQREADREQAEADALLDLQHRGEWHA